MSEANACPIGELAKILLATDGSKESDKALGEALNLAKACNTVFHAVTIVEQNSEYAALAPKAIEKADEDANSLESKESDRSKMAGRTGLEPDNK
jgi:nucleotide-binding universal stress UspA family protein